MLTATRSWPGLDAVFAWERYDSADTLIMSRTLRENGSLDEVQTLSVLGASAQDPDIAVNEARDAAFAWTRRDGRRNRVGGLVDLAASLLWRRRGRSTRPRRRLAECVPLRR